MIKNIFNLTYCIVIVSCLSGCEPCGSYDPGVTEFQFTMVFLKDGSNFLTSEAYKDSVHFTNLKGDTLFKELRYREFLNGYEIVFLPFIYHPPRYNTEENNRYIVSFLSDKDTVDITSFFEKEKCYDGKYNVQLIYNNELIIPDNDEGYYKYIINK